MATVFVALGIWFVSDPYTFQNSGIYYRPKMELLIVGYSCICFFGLGIIVFIIKLFDNKPGLTINDQGLVINFSSAKFVAWNNIKNFEIKIVANQKLLMVALKNPDEYVAQNENSYKKRLMQWLMKTNGNKISIPTNTLKCDFNDLYNLLTTKLKQYKTAGERPKFKSNFN
jgi:hypothetical protein